MTFKSEYDKIYIIVTEKLLACLIHIYYPKSQVKDVDKAPIVPNSGIFEILECDSGRFECESKQERGVMFLCVSSGKIRAVGADYDKFIKEGECIAVVLGRGAVIQPEGEFADVTYAVADGSLVYDLMRLYGVYDFFSALAPDAFEALNEVCFRMKSSSGYSDGIGDAATSFHRFLFKFSRASFVGAFDKGTASEIKKYIDSHLEGKLTLDDLQMRFFVSKTQIFRCFKEAYGIAPIQYCLQQKIELSKKMLSDGRMKISEIAEVLCFTDAKHFTKTFKRITGELPKNYRRRMTSGSKNTDTE